MAGLGHENLVRIGGLDPDHAFGERWWQAPVWSRRGGYGFLVEGSVPGHREEYIGSSAGQRDDGLVVFLAFGTFLLVVAPRGRGLRFHRLKRGEEQRALENPVALV